VLPKSIGGLCLSGLKSARGLVLLKSIGGLCLSEVVRAELNEK